jgi:Holliday junction resolvase RusA-like endonuclease
VSARSITINCTAADLVSANRRIHWSARYNHQQKLRRWAFAEAYSENWAARSPVTITATIRYPDKRRRDVSNLYPYVVKPAIDGLVDAGWLEDDDDAHVASVTIARDPEPGPHRVVITVEEA